MRRYAVRFLVAVLTFGIGVVLSLVFGFFKPQELTQQWVARRPCPKRFTAARPPVLTVDSAGHEPLKLVHVTSMGTSANPNEYQIQLRVTNRSEKRISHYRISSERVWGMNNERDFPWSSNVPLEPGESRSITLTRDVNSSLRLRVDCVTFEDGSTWITPGITASSGK